MESITVLVPMPPGSYIPLAQGWWGFQITGQSTYSQRVAAWVAMLRRIPKWPMEWMCKTITTDCEDFYKHGKGEDLWPVLWVWHPCFSCYHLLVAVIWILGRVWRKKNWGASINTNQLATTAFPGRSDTSRISIMVILFKKAKMLS